LQKNQKDLVRRNAVQFLNRDVKALWPKAVDEGFRWETLAAEGKGSNAVGEDRFATQFWTANVNPTDRYVQSVPGSISYRISPLEVLFDNLTIAGDWTSTGLDTGCIESAVMSGKLAAHAISGAPALEEIVGYDHP
jgi:Flavin containing amine oxidoreductase